ncbi:MULTISPECIES: PspC domain-containing protein [Actinosynnema]|uniref:PspC domain-containing protein n=1 Tax=Actinosynnema TaxID=40566 RepID=UPI0020A38AAC|nr:PspC domain-containing protein [Actinosynnema pretiosum]MCP2095331.1 phage shock protein C (PspC) family protein [Actinosynnema pretiosum]
MVVVSGNVSAAGVEETLKDFWVSRPRRSLGARKVAGVAAGVAERYQLDPVIVRVAFVALALCDGAGLLVYLAGWLLLAQEGDEVSPLEALVGRGRSSTPTALTVLLGLAVPPTSGLLFNGGFALVAGLALSAGAVYLLHSSRGAENRPVPTAPGRKDLGAARAAGTDQEAGVDERGTEPVRPPAWDPLGAAPFAWDLPEPGAAPSAATVEQRPEAVVACRRKRSRVGPLTFGAAMVVLAGSIVAAEHDPWFTLPHIAGLLVGVLGLGMLIGALTGGGGKGLMWLAVPLSAVGVLASVAGFQDFRDFDGPAGSIKAVPVSVGELEPSYEFGAGEVDLDLVGLPEGETARTTVRLGAGTIRVRVPRNADVVATCHTNVGAVSCLDQERQGRQQSVTVDENGPDGPGGLKVELDLRTSLGEVVVTRG